MKKKKVSARTVGKFYQCKLCRGGGKVDAGWLAPIIIKCENCNGTGKVDWIRNCKPLIFDKRTYKWKRGN